MYTVLESALRRFSDAIPSLPGRDNVVVRTMIYTSFINLWKLDHVEHRTFDVAQTIVSLIHQLSDGDYQYLDPIIGVRDA